MRLTESAESGVFVKRGRKDGRREGREEGRERGKFA